MDLAPLAILMLLNKKLVDWLRMWLPTDPDNKWLQAVAFAVGVGLAFLFAESSFGDGIDVWDGMNLGALDALGVVIYGLAIGAGGGYAADFIAGRNPKRT